MSSTEQQQLAAIERHLTAESPDLVRALTDGGHPEPAGRRRRAWAWVVTALIGLVLIGVGIGTGVAALAVAGLCPPLTHLLLVLGERCTRGRSARRW